jgi:hypothetical protein
MSPADLIVDVAGYFPAGSTFTPITNPQRILDTRNGTGAPAARLAGGQSLPLTIAGTAGVPADAAAVVLNVTVANPTAPGFVTVWPCDQPQPLASNLNYVAAQTVPNLVIAKVGTNGNVCLFTMSPADLIVDVAGYFPAGSTFTPITNPQRILDTRLPFGTGAPRGTCPEIALTDAIVNTTFGVSPSIRIASLSTPNEQVPLAGPDYIDGGPPVLAPDCSVIAPVRGRGSGVTPGGATVGYFRFSRTAPPLDVPIRYYSDVDIGAGLIRSCGVEPVAVANDNLSIYANADCGDVTAIFAINASDGSFVSLLVAPAHEPIRATDISADGKSLLLFTQFRDDHGTSVNRSRVDRFDIATRTRTTVFDGPLVTDARLAPDGNQLYLNRMGTGVIRRLDTGTETPVVDAGAWRVAWTGSSRLVVSKGPGLVNGGELCLADANACVTMLTTSQGAFPYADFGFGPIR